MRVLICIALIGAAFSAPLDEIDIISDQPAQDEFRIKLGQPNEPNIVMEPEVSRNPEIVRELEVPRDPKIVRELEVPRDPKIVREPEILRTDTEHHKEPEIIREPLHPIEPELPRQPEVLIPPKKDQEVIPIEEPKVENIAMIVEGQSQLTHVHSWPITEPHSFELFLLNAVHAPENSERVRRV